MITLKLHYTKLQLLIICWVPFFISGELAQAQAEDAELPVINGIHVTKESQPINLGVALAETTVEAARITGVRDQYIEAEGNAVIIRGDQEFRGNYLLYDQIYDEITGREDVSIKKPKVFILGDTLKYSPSTEKGEITGARYFFTETDARGQAEKLIFEGPNRQRAIDATYTSCDVAQEDVLIKTTGLNIYQDEEYGVARNASVWFKGIPILYTPYLSFPLSEKRKSGLLTPSYGQSVQNGLEVTVPFYLNIAPNFDSTIALRKMSERGNLLGSHSRYMGQSFAGEVTYDFINDDSKFAQQLGRDESRTFWTLSHQQKFSSNLSGYAKIQGVSDDAYFKDLSKDQAKTSLVHLPREIGLSTGGANWNASGRVVHYQTLNFAEPPVRLDPQIDIGITPNFGYGFESESRVQISDFDHRNQNGALRTILYPGLRYVYENDFLTLSPKVGMHYTKYDLDTGASEDRSVPIYSIRASLAFERGLTLAGTELTHTLVPEIFYVHAPFKDQRNLPLLDTGLSDFSLAQIHSENIFSGGDRINDADQLTVGLTSQFVDTESGVERFQFAAAQRLHLDEELVLLDDTHTPRNGSRSNILLAGRGRISQGWSADMLLQYNAVLDVMINSDHRLQYKPEEGKVFNFGYRRARDTHEQFDVSGQWPIKGRWGGAGRWNYAKDSGKLIEGVVGLEYKKGCWAFRLVANRLLTGQDLVGSDLYATSFFVQLELKGITRVGSNAVGALRDRIGGYSSQ